MTVYVTKTRGLNPVDGLAGGAIAGVAQTVIAMIYSLIAGKSFWNFPLLLSTLVGRAGTGNGFNTDVLIGIVVNIVLLALLGVLFAMIARNLDQKSIIWAGLIFALVVWAIGYFLILPTNVIGWSPRLHDEAGRHIDPGLVDADLRQRSGWLPLAAPKARAGFPHLKAHHEHSHGGTASIMLAVPPFFAGILYAVFSTARPLHCQRTA
jgi:hypothetical protein